MLLRFLPPTTSFRLFDPMPLPRPLRIQQIGRFFHAGKSRSQKNPVTFSKLNFDKRFMRRIPTVK